MANQNPENDKWIDASLARLRAAPGWTPNPDAALTRLRQRQRARRAASRGWIWTTAVTSCVSATLFLFPAPRACAQKPGACVLGMWRVVATPEPQAIPIAANFKETGSPTAPITLDIYIDYDCPRCEALLQNVLPEFTEKCVRTGKARIAYHDYPLPTHPYAGKAARYANAAGELGYYDPARKQIFATRPFWNRTGDLDAQLAQVLPAKVMEKLRMLLAGDPKPDDSQTTDTALAQADNVRFTPFIVIASQGKRYPLETVPPTAELLQRRVYELYANQ